MPFPRSSRVIFRQNPLIEVICQLRFPPILMISSEPPAKFQERIRRAYPLYQRIDAPLGLPPEVARLFSQLPISIPGANVTHQFSNSDQTRFVTLSEGFVAVSEQRYQRWEEFKSEVSLAELAVREIYNPEFYSRVGLLYQNTIDRERWGLGGVDWSELLHPSFSGLLGAEDVRGLVRESTSTESITVPEVQDALVTIRHGLASVADGGRLAYTISADFYKQGRCISEQAFGELDIFNRLAGDLFRWAITSRLEEALDPRPVD